MALDKPASPPSMLPESVWVASDHAGFQLKSFLITMRPQYPWSDLGPGDVTSVDYPVYAEKLVAALVKSPSQATRGVLICGSGVGMSIAANRDSRIRAALCWSAEVARLARAHNDANVLCLGERLLDPDLALQILDVFLATPFEGGRHARRVQLLAGS